MKFENLKENVKSFCRKVGKRNFIIAGAVALIALAVVINIIIFAGGDDGFGHDTDVGLNNQNTTALSDNPASLSDTFFATTQLNRQRDRDEAIEVLQGVIDNDNSTETMKNEATAKIGKIADTMEKEANIETLIIAKGFEKCVAVVSEDKAVIVVNGETLQPAQISQINEIVYVQTGILPLHIQIINR